MNFSQQLQHTKLPGVDCPAFLLHGGVPRQFSTYLYTVLVINIVILVITCPFTIVLNVLVIFAVRKKRRLQTTSNIALACLAATDAIVGIIVHPILISLEVLILQDDCCQEVCQLLNTVSFFSKVLTISSLAHLVLMSAERYMAIKHTYTYHETVTKTRVLLSSILAWIVSAVLQIPVFLNQNILPAMNNAFIVASLMCIIFFNLIVYRETRRHVRQIADQQVSVEASEKFSKEKKALKTTNTIVVMLTLCYAPTIFFVMISNTIKHKISINALFVIYISTATLVLVNSLLNPLVYPVRLRQFRVAFTEILLNKNHAEAEQFDERLFGPVVNQREERNEVVHAAVSAADDSLDTN